MTASFEDLQRAFTILDASKGAVEELKALALGRDEETEYQIQLAIDAAGNRHVLMPVPSGTEVRTDQVSAGVQCGAHELLIDGDRRTFVDLVCLIPHLRDVFVRLAVEVLERVAAGDARADECAAEVLARWRALLGRSSSSGPSEEQIVGIIGELQMLLELVRIAPEALKLWVGPTGGIQDFRGASHALEVKATTVRRGWRAKIHGIHQLSDAGLNELGLSIVHLDHDEEGGRSVVELMNATIEAGVDAVHLHDLVAKTGLGAEHMETAGRRRYRLIDRKVWLVGEDFPRVTGERFDGGCLPEGVAALDYELDLTARSSESLAAEDLSAFLERLAGDVA